MPVVRPARRGRIWPPRQRGRDRCLRGQGRKRLPRRIAERRLVKDDLEIVDVDGGRIAIEDHVRRYGLGYGAEWHLSIHHAIEPGICGVADQCLALIALTAIEAGVVS